MSQPYREFGLFIFPFELLPFQIPLNISNHALFSHQYLRFVFLANHLRSLFCASPSFDDKIITARSVTSPLWFSEQGASRTSVATCLHPLLRFRLAHRCQLSTFIAVYRPSFILIADNSFFSFFFPLQGHVRAVSLMEVRLILIKSIKTYC